MRKRSCMGIMLAAAAAATMFFLYFSRQNSVTLEIAGEGINSPLLNICVDKSSNQVFMWQDEEKGYFFLPSCIKSNRIRLGDTGENSVRIDGELLEPGDAFVWEEERSYQLQITDASYEQRTYEVVFMESENIPAVFIDTDSGSLDNLHDDRENEETGKICVVREDGVTEYQDELPRISGRGNSTWEYEKKPYALKLKAPHPLCGLNQSDRWRLLALWREGSRLDNKIAMDISEGLGLAYSPQGTWVDLYLNGEYRGIYLLAESVTVGEGRVDIHDLEKENKSRNPSIELGTAERYKEEGSKGYLLEDGADTDGGYLIEKDHPKHWEAEVSGFQTSRGDYFTINAPRHASREQVTYIADYVDGIDAQIQSGDAGVWERLDITSFAKRFLVDEIALEMDAGSTSMFFYKDRGDGKLYSGPPWDYDNAFGETSGSGSAYIDYTETDVHNNERLLIALNWYQKLYETPELYQCIVEEYAGMMPFFERLLSVGIDGYAERIRASVSMDDARWRSTRESGGSFTRYENYDASVNYTKFFLANRLNCLCARWGVSHEPFSAPQSGEMHQVTFSVYEGVVETLQVPDGSELSYTPEYDASKYQGWTYRRSGEPYSGYIPVYEDMELYNAKWE